MKPTIYITGNDSLPPTEYEEQLERAEKKIRDALPHAAIINPTKLGIPDSWNKRETLELRLRVLRQANAVVFFHGYIKGPLAKEEYYEATSKGKDVFLANQISMLRNEYEHLCFS